MVTDGPWELEDGINFMEMSPATFTASSIQCRNWKAVLDNFLLNDSFSILNG